MTTTTLEAEIVEVHGEDRWVVAFYILDRVAMYIFLALVIYVGLGCFDMLRVASNDMHVQYLRLNGRHGRYPILDCINC